MRLIIILFLFIMPVAKAQELFTYSEPASNMPSRSLGIRATQLYQQQVSDNVNWYLLEPELMIGFSSKLMAHLKGFFTSSADMPLGARGGSAYFKYRFYSADEIHSHFRIAAYGLAATNNLPVMQEAIDLSGMNSGFEAGAIATRLINKLALSSSVSVIRGTKNSGKQPASLENRDAFAFSVSAGKLMLPKVYNSYEQTNLNLMLEMPGQVSLGNGKMYLDLAPSIQLIFFSQLRVDAGYRFPVVNKLQRMADRGFLLRLEYNMFSVW